MFYLSMVNTLIVRENNLIYKYTKNGKHSSTQQINELKIPVYKMGRSQFQCGAIFTILYFTQLYA